MFILIVDDSHEWRRVLTLMLREIGITDIEEAVDGEHALRVLEFLTPDLIITDWNMPNIDGYELVRRIKNDRDWQTIPIMMVTSRDQKEDVVKAMKAKADSYIVKPFTPEILRKKIREIVSKPDED